MIAFTRSVLRLEPERIPGLPPLSTLDKPVERDAVVVDWAEAKALMAAAPPAPRPGLERVHRHGVLVQALLDAGAPEWVSWVDSEVVREPSGRAVLAWWAPQTPQTCEHRTLPRTTLVPIRIGEDGYPGVVCLICGARTGSGLSPAS